MQRNFVIALGALVLLVASVSVISATRPKQDIAPSAAGAVTGTTSVRTPDQVGHGEPGSTVAPFSVKDIDGRGAGVRAGTPGALFFFASWCGSCLPEAKALGQLQRDFGSRVAITAISSDPTDSAATIAEFRRQVGNPPYAFVSDAAGTLATQFAVRALDTTIVYDAKGRVVFRDAAPTDANTLQAAFAKAGVK